MSNLFSVPCVLVVTVVPRVHVRPDTHEIERCRAVKGPCSFGTCYDTMDEAEHVRKGLLLQEAKSLYGETCVTAYDMSLPAGVDGVLKDLSSVGNPLVVGGAVRDSLSGHASKDIDIEVHGSSIGRIIKYLKGQGYHVDEVGRQFGVLKVSKGGVKNLDVSVPRRENRVGVGHKAFAVEFSENMSVSEAAERRDFTFNAIMYDHHRGVIVDPTNGVSDYRDRVMRAVSDRFSEDPLRVLRGFQFAARFGMRYDEDTARMCQTIREEYSDLSVERVREEFHKFFTKGEDYSAGVRALQDSGWDSIEPGLRESLDGSRTVAALNNLTELDPSQRSVIGAAIILKGISTRSDRENFARVATMSKSEATQAITLSELGHSDMCDDYTLRKTALALARKGTSYRQVRALAKTCGDSSMVAATNKAIKMGMGDRPAPDLVTGKDILPISGRVPGRWVGDLLDQVREAQYKGEVTSRHQALDLARRLTNSLEDD